MHQVKLLEKDKREKRKAKEAVKREKFNKMIEANEGLRKQREKKERDEFWRVEGKKRVAQEEAAGHGNGSKRRRK